MLSHLEHASLQSQREGLDGHCSYNAAICASSVMRLVRLLRKLAEWSARVSADGNHWNTSPLSQNTDCHWEMCMLCNSLFQETVLLCHKLSWSRKNSNWLCICLSTIPLQQPSWGKLLKSTNLPYQKPSCKLSDPQILVQRKALLETSLWVFKSAMTA